MRNKTPKSKIFITALLLLSPLSYAQETSTTTKPAVDPIPDAVLRGSLDQKKFGKFDGTFDCEKFKTKNIGCEPGTVIRNCKALSEKIPAKEALNYTLQYFFENHGELQDPKCALASDVFEVEVFSEAEVRKGITSPRFILRDMAAVKASSVESYLVDLCSGEFEEFKSFVGTGTTKDSKGFVDIDDKHTTLTGAFLTDDKTSRLNPSNPGDYKQIMKNYGDETRVYLVGLNSSNNSTVLSKPMHITPYNSSWGCPSVPVEHADILTKFVKDGQRSLLMTYDKESMQALGDGAVCENGEGRANFKATAIQAQPKVKKKKQNSKRQRRKNRGQR